MYYAYFDNKFLICYSEFTLYITINNMPEQQPESSDAWKQEAIQKSVQDYIRRLASQKAAEAYGILSGRSV